MTTTGRWTGAGAIFILLAMCGLEARADQFEDLNAVRNELALLTPISEEKLQLVIKELSSDDFATRQSARQRLIRAPESWKPFLKELLEKTEDPELQMGLKQILENMDPKQLTAASGLAKATLIHGHRGLGIAFLEALPSVPDHRSAELVIAAARLSVTDEEKEDVLQLLSAQNSLLREGAARVIPVLVDDPRDLLRNTLEDADGMVQLAAAEVFAARADPACLNPLFEMMAGNDLYPRWRAGGMLRLMTSGGIDRDPLKKADPADLNLEKWKQPGALKAWVPGTPLPLIPLFEETEDLSSWTLARGSLADIPRLTSEDGQIRSTGTGLYTWASPWRFHNYRIRLDWQFGCDDRNSNAGFSLAKFKGPPPTQFDAWMRGGSVEVEIRSGTSGSLYPSGTELQANGKKIKGEVKIRHPHNEQGEGWNTLEVEERHGSLRVWVNGLLQNEVTGLSDDLTTFGLRVDRSSIAWRNLMLEPLPGARIAPPLEAEEQKPE
ncbi:MAG: family 16 glycoside hydrolase [Akkermansiaceae bacterium]